ncbi:hypothetical protein ABL_06167 [Aspergillus niger]|uniref:Uncharacterized protein n=1 Tax=Aspergillus niger TaxID=5061 RepID=A0A124BXU5_ASPNG|nr:hypothetical protein ABL_06167 [Aspergillus niger]
MEANLVKDALAHRKPQDWTLEAPGMRGQLKELGNKTHWWYLVANSQGTAIIKLSYIHSNVQDALANAGSINKGKDIEQMTLSATSVSSRPASVG